MNMKIHLIVILLGILFLAAFPKPLMAQALPDTTGIADALILEAEKHMGKPYRWAADGPEAFDCSGFIKYVFARSGITLPRVSEQQFKAGEPIEDVQELRKGDIVFFGKKRSIRQIGHVGIVTEVDLMRASFRFIHCSESEGVHESDCNSSSYYLMRYMGARRVF